MIPQLIIQTGPPGLPLFLRAATVNVQLLHPGFTYRFFDDTMIEDFLSEHFPEYVADYHSFRFRIQKYDFFRYLAVYRLGGFYLDIDVFLAQAVTPLLDHGCVFAFEELSEAPYFWDAFQMDWQIGNYAFGAQAGHPFLAAVIENCLRAKRDPGWVKPMMKGIPSPLADDFYVLNTTGPGVVSRTFAENPALAARMHVLFPEDVCDRRHWHHFGRFGVHHMAGSWRRPAGIVGRLRTRFWGERNLRRILTAARSRGRTRSAQMLQPAGLPADAAGTQ